MKLSKQEENIIKIKPKFSSDKQWLEINKTIKESLLHRKEREEQIRVEMHLK